MLKIKCLKKHPEWEKLFIQYVEEDSHILEKDIERVFLKIQNNKKIFKNLLKSAKFYLTVIDQRNLLERLEDQIDAEIHQHKKMHFIKSLKTAKYKHLFNKKIEKEIETIIDNKVTIKTLKKQFFNKIAKFKTSEDLFENLIKFKNKNIGWNREHYLNLIENKRLDVDILNDQNGYMVISLQNYEACKELGSQAWCIVQHEDYFHSYIGVFDQQIIIFNFDLPIEDPKSIIGFTTFLSGEIKYSHLKDDSVTDDTIKEQFSFPKLNHERISDILKNQNPQVAMRLICSEGLDEFFDEYKDKPDYNQDFNYLRSAASSNSERILKELLEMNHVFGDKEHKQAIEAAVNHNCLKTFKVLYNHEKTRSLAEIFTLLVNACRYGCTEIAKILLKDKSIDPSKNNNVVIKMASRHKDKELLEMLIKDKRVDPSTSDNTPLRNASTLNNLEIVKMLLKSRKVNPSAKDNSPLRNAVRHGNEEMVDAIINHDNFNHESDLRSSIIESIHSDSLAILKKLMNMNKDRSILNDLYLKAIDCGFLNIIEYFVKEQGINPREESHKSIIIAIKKNRVDVLKFLLKDKKIDPSENDDEALRVASSLALFNIVKELSKDERCNMSIYHNMVIKSAQERNEKDVVNYLLTNLKVCLLLKNDWIHEHLDEDQIKIYNKTLENTK